MARRKKRRSNRPGSRRNPLKRVTARKQRVTVRTKDGGIIRTTRVPKGGTVIFDPKKKKKKDQRSGVAGVRG